MPDTLTQNLPPAATAPAGSDGFAIVRNPASTPVDEFMLFSQFTPSLVGAQPVAAALTAIVGLSTNGLVERTGAGTAAIRAIGVGAASSVPTRADADARYASVAPLLAVSKTADATLALGDVTENVAIVEVSSGSAVAITVPSNASVAFPVGTMIEIVRIGAGAVTVVAGGGVIFQPSGTATISAQFGSVFLRKRATDTWIVQ